MNISIYCGMFSIFQIKNAPHKFMQEYVMHSWNPITGAIYVWKVISKARGIETFL